MISEEALKNLNRYNNLPDTPEKIEINRKYKDDEISNYDFYSEAMSYLSKFDLKNSK